MNTQDAQDNLNIQDTQDTQDTRDAQDIKNTQDIIIDAEFSLLLPALDKATYALLEESLLKYGCRDPLVLWNGILIDGSNRLEICQKHDIPFNTVNMEFASRDAALVWIISAQIARRNLNPFQLSYYRGMHYNAVKRARGGSDRLTQESPKSQNGTWEKSTATSLANQYNVSRNTILRDAQLADAVTAIGKTSFDAQRNILAGKARISRKKLQELSSGSEDDVTSVAARIAEGTYTKSEPDPTEAPPLEKEFKKASDGFYREILSFSRNGDAGALRLAYRSYMDTLKEIFAHI